MWKIWGWALTLIHCTHGQQRFLYWAHAHCMFPLQWSSCKMHPPPLLMISSLWNRLLIMWPLWQPNTVVTWATNSSCPPAKYPFKGTPGLGKKGIHVCKTIPKRTLCIVYGKLKRMLLINCGKIATLIKRNMLYLVNVERWTLMFPFLANKTAEL